MTEWFKALVEALLIPVLSLIIGIIFKRFPPKNINSFYGYRTPMSKKNEETWRFANNHSARLLIYIGLILTPASVIPLLFLMKKSSESLAITSLIITLVEVVVLLSSSVATEVALRRNFERDGSRRADIEPKNKKL